MISEKLFLFFYPSHSTIFSGHSEALVMIFDPKLKSFDLEKVIVSALSIPKKLDLDGIHIFTNREKACYCFEKVLIFFTKVFPNSRDISISIDAKRGQVYL
jgi:hypothetical protein